MSAEQNIQIAKNCYAAFGRGDVPAILAALDDSVEWVTPEVDLPTGGVRHGKPEVAQFFQAVSDAWEFQAFEAREYVASGDRVAVCGSYTMTGKVSGRTAACDWAMVWTFRDGKVVRFQEYTDTSALKDAYMARAAA